MVKHSNIFTLCVCVCAFCAFYLAELQLRILLNIYKIQLKQMFKKNEHINKINFPNQKQTESHKITDDT